MSMKNEFKNKELQEIFDLAVKFHKKLSKMSEKEKSKFISKEGIMVVFVNENDGGILACSSWNVAQQGEAMVNLMKLKRMLADNVETVLKENNAPDEVMKAFYSVIQEANAIEDLERPDYLG